MNERRAILSSALKTVFLGKICIGCTMDRCFLSGFRRVLASQLHELDAIESEARRIAFRRGWDLAEPDPVVLFLWEKCFRFRLLGRRSDSALAGLLIREHTGGSIRVLQQLHRFRDEDPSLQILCQKILDCETAAIRQLQNFL